MAQRIIVNADDLGLAPSVNDAIFEVFRAGNLNSATLMVAMPGTADAVERLKDHPGLAVGLHFTLTEGRALTGPSSLTDGAGMFGPRKDLAMRAMRGQVKSADLRREFEAQLDRAEALGVSLTHSDSHQHVMMLPAVFDAVAPVIAERRLGVRLVHPPARMVLGAWARPVKLLKQALNLRNARRHRSRHALRTNDSLVSIHDLNSPGPYTAGTYQALLATTNAQEVVEVMVHPYRVDDALRAMYASTLGTKEPFFQRCIAEYEALRHGPVFGDRTMINFAQL
ncbi:MAG: ChbG/HpnK family deacetylase [Flavobacteriales bacterium]|nr:ChbG/HpnK family deacetylase [Flavobacteriales bacterium]